MIRIGHGYDVHKYVENRKLILGGIEIPYEYGLAGHSDADVLTHAIMDSILGALALGDIGKFFPDTDPKYKGADSIKLLQEILTVMNQKGYSIVNIDSTIIVEKPKLRSYIDKIRENLCDKMNIDLNDISIKATTEEGLGFTGKLEGIRVHSVILLKKCK